MEYRIKAAARMIMELTREEAFELGRVVDDVQKRFHIGDRAFPFDKMPKEDVAAHIGYILKDETLVIPAHLKGHLERFLELMINERAPMDELSYEYSRAFGILLYYDLLKLDTEDGQEDKEEPLPDREGQTSEPEGPSAPSSGATDPKNGSEDELEKESERRKGLSDIADKIVDSLMEQDMTFYEMLSVIDTARMNLKAERALYRRRLDNTPIKGLWAMEERGQQEDG